MIKISFSVNKMLWLILFIILIVFLIIYTEYQEHDCLPHKTCNQSVEKPRLDDNPLITVDKIRAMTRNNYNFVTWRLALLAGIIASLPIVYYLRCGYLDVFEWLIVALLIFGAAYFSSSWIWAHFFYPNGNEIEKSLTQLRDKIQTLIMYRYSEDIDQKYYSNSYSDSDSIFSNS